jgi:acyl-lipid omega-6 desaturase (Delta-12 desaturase)
MSQPSVQPATLHARTKAFARDNPWKSWWCIVSSTLLLAAFGVGTLPPWPMSMRVACSLLSGLLMVRMFVIFHDQQHHAILPKSRLAEFCMRVYGIWFLTPTTIWRSSHDYHHAHNSKLRSAYIGSYPIMTRDQFEKSPTGERLTYLAMRHPLTILFGYFTVFLFGMVICPFARSPRKHFDSLIALIVHVAAVAALVLLSGWTTMFLFLILPRLIGCALGSYLFYAQHNFPGVVFGDKNGWTFEKAALDSSSYMKTGRVLSWFTGNIGYHHIHHLNHRVPFYRLPEVFRAIPELRAAKTTTLNPIDVFRCLRLKVWCVDTQRMVGLNGR